MPSSRASQQRDYARAQALLAEAKSVPCADCGILYPWYVMDFDHVRGVKRFNIGAYRSAGTNVLLAEIAKCDVVCSNCHRIRTYERKLKPA